MSENTNQSADTAIQSFQPTALKPLLALLAFCISFLVVAFFLQVLGFGLWAGLFGALFVVFTVTVILGAVLMWTLGKVGY